MIYVWSQISISPPQERRFVPSREHFMKGSLSLVKIDFGMQK